MSNSLKSKIGNDFGVQQDLLSTADGVKKYEMYLDRFLEIELGQIKWSDLPDTIDERYLELCLLKNGSALFFRDDIIGYIGIGTTSYGKWNIYGIPEERTGYGANGAQFKRNSSDSVIIWNKLTHGNDWDLLGDYASKLALIDEIIMINVNAQKTPILLKCNEKQRLTLKNLYAKYRGNQPFIFADDGLDISGIQTLSTGAPYIADDLYNLKTNIWNEALTYIGVVNVQTNKKERLITDEVIKANGGTMASRETRIRAREIACKEINKMFGLNLSVEFVDSNEREENMPNNGVTENDSRETMKEGEVVHG